MVDGRLVLLLLTVDVLLLSHSKLIFVDEAKNWTEAQVHCRRHFDDLVTVTSPTFNQHLLMAAGGAANVSDQWAWLGLRDEPHTWTLSADQTFRTHTNAPHLTWSDNQPNNLHSEQHCIQQTQAGLNDIPCIWPRSFICSDARSSSGLVLVEKKISWSEAQTFCRTNHDDLANLRNHEDATKIQDFFSKVKLVPVWTGLYRTAWTSWSNHGHSSFSNWNDSQPDNTNNSQSCVAISLQSGKWDDRSCREERPFFCFQAIHRTFVKVALRSTADLLHRDNQEQLLVHFKARMLSLVPGGVHVTMTTTKSLVLDDQEEKCSDPT